MTSEIPVESAPPQVAKPKQFMMMVGEIEMALLSRLHPFIQFVEIEAMHMMDNVTHQLLVNPLPKPAEVVAIDAPAEPVADIVA